MSEETFERFPKPKTFQIGDTVTWTSQAGGNTKTKTGRVIAIVPANSNPRLALPLGFKLKSDALMMRDHESYLIQVGKSKRLYWPLVKYLKPAELSPLEKYKRETEPENCE